MLLFVYMTHAFIFLRCKYTIIKNKNASILG